MQKWEYCRLYTTPDGFSSISFCRSTGALQVPIKRDRERGDRDTIDARMRTVAELGVEGWEMVSVYHDGDYPQMLFKRPLLHVAAQSLAPRELQSPVSHPRSVGMGIRVLQQ